MITSKLFWITIIIMSFYIYLKYIVFGYWRRKGIPYEQPTLIFGNILPWFRGKVSLGQIILKNYEKFSKHPYHGMYILYKPVLIINDPELIRCVLIKEFQKFRNRNDGIDEKLNPLAANLFFLTDEKWKRIRNKLTPTFTSGKLKMMLPSMKTIGDELATVVGDFLDTDNIIEIKDFTSRYTMDIISCLAFGWKSDSLKNPNNEFRQQTRYAFQTGPLKNTLLMFASHILKFFHIKLLNKKFCNFFINIFVDTVEYREKENIVKNDFLNMLMQLMDKKEIQNSENMKNLNKTDKNDELTILEACAQAFVFFMAGMESSSSTITYCLYELALNPDIQEKLQKEIDEYLAKPDGLSYSNIISEMKYLDMVFNETLRKRPIGPLLFRVCTEAWTVPNSNYTIPKGMSIVIPVCGIHGDPKFYPEPDKFDPERFSKENIDSRSSYTFLAFGDGPRICIGDRLGILQSKVALISLLSKFKFSPCEKTPIPIQYSLSILLQSPRDSIFLKVERR